MPFVGPIQRYTLNQDGSASLLYGAILPITADPERCYPYRPERLFFIQLGESVFAVMAESGDDAWNQVWSVGRSG
jgi:hypothetical protein